MYRHSYAAVLAAVPNQLRLIAPFSLLPGALLVLCIPFIASTQNLYQPEAAIILDRLFSLAGILLFTPLMQPEQNKAIKEVVASKRVSSIFMVGVRCAIALVAMVLYAVALCAVMRLGGSDFPFWQFTFAACGSAVFLGSLGFAAGTVGDNWIIGYLVPVCYYFICYGSGEQYLRYLYLFSLAAQGYVHKFILSATGAVILAGTFAYLLFRRRKVSAI